MELEYVTGDATRPGGSGARVVAHVCNDVGGFGSGFAGALNRRFGAHGPGGAYRRWHRDGSHPDATGPFGLGEVQFVDVGGDLTVANMIGQRDVITNTPPGAPPPIRYDAVRSCLIHVRRFCLMHGASVHAPRFGSGLAGGDWQTIEALIVEELSERGVAVVIYDLA